MSPTVAEVAAALDAGELRYADPRAPVRTVRFAVDTTPDVATGADLLVARRLPSAKDPGTAVYLVDDEVEVASDGTAAALAAALGLTRLRPLVACGGEDVIVTQIPPSYVDKVVEALSAAGAGIIGGYSRCAWTSRGTGTFLPGDGTRPVIGANGRRESVGETRVEMLLPRARRAAVVTALLAVHPYEQPPYYVLELAVSASARGYGRVGVLPGPLAPRELAELVVRRVPGAEVRFAGGKPIRTVAVCPTAGAGHLAAAVAAGVDAYVGADLPSRAVAECVGQGGPVVFDLGAWAAERPWLDWAAQRLREAFPAVEVSISDTVTGPWGSLLAEVEITGEGAEDHRERGARQQ